jgi:hypothetical protein
MAVNQNQNRKITQRPGGFFEDFANRFRLIGRLMLDTRVNPFLKILPVATLIYVVSPVDLLPLNPVDDAFLIWAGTTLFVELCPPQVVQEHTQLLNKVVSGQWKDFSAGNPVSQEDVVEGEYTETDASGKDRPNP